MSTNGSGVDVDVVVVGAGMAGLYALHRLRGMGISAVALETADDVGGTWYWNRYPGARCDVMSQDYSYSFDPELDAEWEWSEKYATQPEILRYLQHVADRFDLRRDIRFETSVESASWDDEHRTWAIATSAGDTVRCRWYIMATGCLSAPKDPDIEGADAFGGDVYFTSRWPHGGVDLTGKRVAVIGTGSSAIQSIPIMAQQAAELTVFQRTPNFSMPANNGPVPDDRRAMLDEAGLAAYREAARNSPAGVPMPVPTESALAVSDEERNRRYQHLWDHGHIIAFSGAFADVGIDEEANDTVAEFFRTKIRETVDDPETAESLCPTTYPVFTKRLCVDSGYYETFNLPHVRLVDLRKDPLVGIEAGGVRTGIGLHEVDVIVFATGFDAMTGAIVKVDITGRDGAELRDRWADGPLTYLGIMTAGFPNLFMVTGPQSPSVLSNMAVSIEQHVEWITDTLAALRDDGLDTIEPTETAETGWVRHAGEFAGISLMDKANSWYVGANVPGKARVVMPYLGGVDRYRRICDEVVERDFLGFTRRGPSAEREVDGIVCRLQPDVMVLLDVMADLGLPPIETLPVEDARAFMAASSAERPPGPDVGEIVDGTLPGADGDLAYRLYRPDSAGPHPVVAYFHGGGWVLGDSQSDDPLCRYLCAHADTLVISVDYRHAPEARFPAAADDAIAAVRWISRNAASLGGDPARLALAGWSAGANLAAVACQQLRESDVEIRGQVLITPVTDSDPTRSSFEENADGYVLTAGLMAWFWDHYVHDAHRKDPRVSPLLAADLSGLPPAMVVTCEFDPLRDEGDAYAEALEQAGVEVRHLPCAGQIHTSIPSVDVIVTAEPARAEIAATLRSYLGVTVDA
ncbi:MAG: alpha/beta hydrolase fold domain-containing protein [Actinomycetota bacterium]